MKNQPFLYLQQHQQTGCTTRSSQGKYIIMDIKMLQTIQVQFFLQLRLKTACLKKRKLYPALPY